MEQVIQEVKKQSVFDKYDIPIDHYEFDYIRDCTNVKELEKIIKVLRSTEANSFPELLQTAENKLRDLHPDHRLLRVATKPLTKEMFRPEDFQSFVNEINDWSSEFSKKERALQRSKPCTPDEEAIPAVRVSSKAKDTDRSKTKQDKTKSERIKSFEYDKWDKFDAEAECLKMDIHEEKRNQQLPDKMDNFQEEVKEVERIASLFTKSFSKVEKEKTSFTEKELGNECYKLGEWKEAIRHYSKSIGTFPTAVVYNNRAAAYLKLNMNEQAITDATFVIQMEPSNNKALYRRALAYQAVGYFTEATMDINKILRDDPTHNAAEKLRQKLIKESRNIQKRELIKSNSDVSLPGPSGLSNEELRKAQMKPHIEEISATDFRGNVKIVEVESKLDDHNKHIDSKESNTKNSEIGSDKMYHTIEEMRSAGLDVWEL